MSKLFLTTHWTRVLASRGDTPEAQDALSELCAAYYAPVLTFLRQSGHDEDAARDLAHEFFATLLQRHGLEGVDPQRGRFRTYLLAGVKHFVSNQRARALCTKRGAGAVHESLAPTTETSGGLDIADDRACPPDQFFDREWALNLLDRALKSLQREAETEGNARAFAILRPWLTGDRTDLSQAEAARMLGMSDGAVRVAIHRLRRRFRELVKGEIAETVGDPAELEDELHYLISVLS